MHRRSCNVLEFIVHMRRWQRLPNPTRVLDYDGDTITWAHIVDRLDEFDVDFRELDGPLYEKLRACEDEDALIAILFEVKFLQTSGMLEQRCKDWKDQGAQIVDSQLKDETDRRYPMSLNNKRFSHRYPMGVDVHDFEAEIMWTAEGAKGQSDADKKLLANPGKWWTACGSMAWHSTRRYCHYPAWRYIVFTAVVFVPLLGGLVYMWLQEDGCGDRCLDQAPE